MSEEARTIELTPNFAAMFKQFLADAKNSGTNTFKRDARALREVQGWFAPLTIAAQCMTTVEEVEQFREVMSEMLKYIDDRAAKLENEEEG